MRRPFAKLLTGLCLVTLPLALPTALLADNSAPTAEEMAELRAMVMQLSAEVADLRAELAARDAAPAPTAAMAPAAVPASPVAPRAAAPVPADTVKPAATSKFGMSFYGYVKLDAWWDSALPSHQEIPFWVRPDAEGVDSSFDMTAKETRLGIDFGGPSVRGGNVSAKLEMDLYGDISAPGDFANKHAYKLRTRHVYTQWKKGDWTLLAGKTWDPYITQFPSMLNFGYYSFSGQLGLRKTQLRMTHESELGDGKLALTLAAVEPTGGIHGADVDGDKQDDGTDAGMPLMVVKGAYSLPMGKRMADAAVAVVYGREELDLLDQEHDVWAVQAGLNVPLGERFGWKLNLFRGSNLDSLWGGIGQGINTSLDRAISASGGWTQLEWKATDALTLHVGYSIDNPDNGDLGFGARSRNESYLVNAFYAFDPALVLGLELYRGKTEYTPSGANQPSTSADNTRVQSSLIYKF